MNRRWRWLAAAAVAAAASAGAWARADDPFARWRPRTDVSLGRYVGSDACTTCHEREAARFATTPMARAAAAPATSDVLEKTPRLSFREGPFAYSIERRDGRVLYTVRNGDASISEPILACFGEGGSGQTFMFRHDGAVYEGRVSYFARLRGLDITILHSRAQPTSLDEALGRRMTDEAARGCFSCHTAARPGDPRLEVDRNTPGLGCESCHGPGEQHIAAMKLAPDGDRRILDPRGLDAIELSQELCGACHMSFDDVMLRSGPDGPETIRFQPYRLFKSASHVLPDRRMGCVACHDPHGQTTLGPASADAKCLTCHRATPLEAPTATRTAKPCPTHSTGCVACHMPTVELPDMHATFTDHYIRVVEPAHAR